MISLQDVTKRYGAVDALHAVDLEVNEGDWLALLGHNGSGKSTIIRIMLGLCTPTDGTLTLEGEVPDVRRWRAFHERVGFMPERIAFYENLTGLETLAYFARLRGVDAPRATAVLDDVGLGAAASRKVGEYSKGMRQRLNLAQALLHDPAIVILDEPLEGLDPEGVRTFFELLRSRPNRTVVLSSHRLSQVGGVSNRVCFLSQGRIRACEDTDRLFEKADLPARIHVFLSATANGTLKADLGRLGATSVDAYPDRVVAHVKQASKMGFLAGLESIKTQIRSIHVEEPTLEDVYGESIESDSHDRG